MPALDLSGARWRKSSRSTANANCVEVAVLDGARWQKSSRSTDNANCIEVAFTGGVLVLPPHAWTAFTTALRRHEFG